MLDSAGARLSSAHLEDLAIVALTAEAEGGRDRSHLALSASGRARLRSRLKQLSRHDWPASMVEDPLLRRGYTLRQCCRLVVGLLLLDAHLPPSIAVPIARDNELTFLRAVHARLSLRPGGSAARRHSDPVAVLVLGELWGIVDQAGSGRAVPARVRLVERERSLAALASRDERLAFAGQRLLVDVAAAVSAAWEWMRDGRLLPEEEMAALLADVAARTKAPGYAALGGRTLRR